MWFMINWCQVLYLTPLFDYSHLVQTDYSLLIPVACYFIEAKSPHPDKNKGLNFSLHKKVPETKEAVKLTSESFHHPLQLQHSKDADSTESFNNLFSTSWRAQKISSGEINIMQKLLNKEQCPKSYKPILALHCPCRHKMFTFDTSWCRFAKLSCDMEMWIINSRRLWQLYLLSRLEAMELVVYFPNNEIKWFEWHTNTKTPWLKFPVAIQHCLENIQKVHTNYQHYLPGLIRMTDSYRVVWNVDHICIFYFIYCMTSDICHFSSFCY